MVRSKKIKEQNKKISLKSYLRLALSVICFYIAFYGLAIIIGSIRYGDFIWAIGSTITTVLIILIGYYLVPKKYEKKEDKK